MLKRKLYNNKVKRAYFDSLDIKDNTKKTIYADFKNITIVENDLDKDVFAFNDIEIEDALMSLEYSNVISIRRVLSTLRDYVFWAMANDQRGEYENGINSVDLFLKTEKDMMRYVSNKQLSGMILTREELDDLLNIIDNPIDKLFIQCPYEFISGREMHEMRNMKMKDIDEENLTMVLTDKDGSKRKQKISKKLLKLLKAANDQSEYVYNNGEGGTGRVYSATLTNSEYILRPVRRKGNEDNMFSYSSLGAKYKKIQEFTGYNYINAVALKDTRIVHEVTDLIVEQSLYVPTSEIYIQVMDYLKEFYDITISPMQLYSIKKKYEQVSMIKDFI